MAAFCQRAGKKSIFAAAGNPDLELRTSRIRFARDHWIYEYGLRNVDRIIVQNEEQQRLCRVNFARDATLIPNCYPVNQSRPASAPDLVLWVSTIRRLKRPHFFLDLAEALPGFRFRMIGGPDSAEVALFEAVKQRAAMMANVEFLGFVPYAEIDAHFDEAAVFVNTSESEGFPNTFLQAWARAVPTVSFVDSGARAEGHPVGVQVGSLKPMAEQVALWLGNQTKRRQDGRRCRDYFERHHTPGLVLELYGQVFRELVPNQ
jgi:glycosyltransferase involved in cell wall biosynthesis